MANPVNTCFTIKGSSNTTGQILSSGTDLTNIFALTGALPLVFANTNNITPALGSNCICSSDQFSNILGGKLNTASGNYTTIAGGYSGCTTGNYSHIGGGSCNFVSAPYGVIGGGSQNIASGPNTSFVGGGSQNKALGAGSIVVGGDCNCATFNYTAVLGGQCNYATGTYYNTILNGLCNTANAIAGTIINGTCNTASGIYSTIINGCCNDAKGYRNTTIIGSNLSATAADTTYVNNIAILGKYNTTAALNTSPLTISASAQGSVFNQIQNLYSGVSASTDLSLYNDAGNYLDIGINSAKYNGNVYGPTFNIVGPNDAYVYSTSGNLALGTAAAGTGDVILFAGSTLSGSGASYATTTVYSVTSVTINNNGSGYGSSTAVVIFAGGGGGGGAAATVNMLGGGSSWVPLIINMTNFGSGYTSAPTVSVSANRAPSGGVTPATLTADLGNPVQIPLYNGERLRIVNTTGNVGIGTSSPGQTLTVAGTISAATAVYANGVLLGSTGPLATLSGNWQSTYTTVSANSANWQTSYQSVSSQPYTLVDNLSTILPIRGFNTSSGNYSVVGGGYCNNAYNNCTFVGGGSGNCAMGPLASVVGGVGNRACCAYSFVGGGYCNNAFGGAGVIGGGCYNYLSTSIFAGYSVIGGGCNNCINTTSTGVIIGGGSNNCITGGCSIIAGGNSNCVTSTYSNILGGNNNFTNQTNTFILGSGLSATAANYTYVQNISSQGLVCGTTLCGSASVCSPSICGTTSVCSPSICGSTSVCSPSICGTTSVCGATICGTTSVCSPTICGTTIICSPTICGTTSICGGAGCFSTINTTGNVAIGGSLSIAGSAYQVNAQTLIVGDPIIYMGLDNTTDLYDIGVMGFYNTIPQLSASGLPYGGNASGLLRSRSLSGQGINGGDVWTLFNALSVTQGVLSAVNVPLSGATISTLVANTSGVVYGNNGSAFIGSTTLNAATITTNLTAGVANITGNLSAGNTWISGNSPYLTQVNTGVSPSTFVRNQLFTAVNQGPIGIIPTFNTFTANGGTVKYIVRGRNTANNTFAFEMFTHWDDTNSTWDFTVTNFIDPTPSITGTVTLSSNNQTALDIYVGGLNGTAGTWTLNAYGTALSD
jgi:hypothetical protein